MPTPVPTTQTGLAAAVDDFEDDVEETESRVVVGETEGSVFEEEIGARVVVEDVGIWLALVEIDEDGGRVLTVELGVDRS